ncbi:MAG: peptide chain release factor N(5)-glutamine methyltransferase [Clostridia bacterium]|nr:peptide chain release factor N(5)-glutamine methyltransferase [Clostridia bacterium]
MTIREIAARLQNAGIAESDWEAMLIAEHCTGRSRSLLLLEKDRDFDLPLLAGMVEKRCERYPLQYLFGEWEFMGLSFTVNEHCLIPRPDTEIIVEEALRLLPEKGNVLDLCTGSGCILASILHYCPSACGTAVDLFPETLAVAEENFRKLGVNDRATAICGDVRDGILSPDARFDCIVSNPPYVTAEEMNGLAPELSKEPRAALTDEGDGLSLLAAIIAGYGKYLSAGGVMILEHGAAQSDAVLALGQKAGFSGRVLYDYAGKTRGVVLSRQFDQSSGCDL